jgi:hypothetical protein
LHWYLCVEQTHGRNQEGQVEGKSCIGIFVLNKHMVGTKRVLYYLVGYWWAFINIKHLNKDDEISSLHISQTTLLWRFIQRACRCGWGHERRTCGHVSTSLVLHNEHVMVGYLSGQKRCLRSLPMYWLVQNLINCFIWFSEICGLVKNSLKDMLSIFVSLVHLCILWKFLANLVRWFSVVYFCKYLWKFLIGPL